MDKTALQESAQKDHRSDSLQKIINHDTIVLRYIYT